ncbi:MAG TPA: ABC transporter permease [Micromonosporaceae bacterium]|nr:ABC transporter permease [Micromonosporaceae bacterium]
MTTSPVAASPGVDQALARVLSVRERPARPGPVSTSLTFGWRALLKIKHIPEQLFDVIMFPIMVTVVFTFLLGGALAGSTDDYAQFLVPGILVQTVLLTTMYTGVAVCTDISRGVFDRFRSLSIWRPSPLVGALIGDAVRYTVASVLVVLVGLAIGFRPDGGVLGVAAGILLLLVFAYSIAWLWTMFGVLMSAPTTVMNVSLVVLTPLTFASNIFVDPATMPGWLETIVNANPVSHVVTAVRAAMDGDLTGSQLSYVLIASAAVAVVFIPITMYLYSTKE